MSSIVNKLHKKGLINPPSWLPYNTMFEAETGSVSYGASGGSSDVDVIGFCMPPKDLVFPHLAGEIPGFGRQIQRFEQYQQHHCNDKESKKEYDIAIFSIVKFFQLVMENNPNCIDYLFTPRRCVLHSTEMYEHVRNNRHMFLHKGCYSKFKGYSMSSLTKMKNSEEKNIVPNNIQKILDKINVKDLVYLKV